LRDSIPIFFVSLPRFTYVDVGVDKAGEFNHIFVFL
jgi:hypothetical protein